jgi:predicted acylesterase/phospholipase RssA
MIDTLCFSGGGLECLSYIGIIQNLCKYEYIQLKNIKHLIGTSAGAIASYILCIGFTPNEVTEFFINLNCERFQVDYDIDLFFYNFGFSDGNNILDIMRDLLYQKLNVRDITFIELYNITKKKLSFVSTNFNKCYEKIFSYETTPNISVINALYTSMTIPLIFTPIKIDGDYYVDGGLLNTFPLNYCNPKTTIGIKIGLSSVKLESIQDLITGSILIMSDCANYDTNIYNIITINKGITDFGDFNITTDNVRSLINKGLNITKKFLKKQYKNKIDDILKNIVKKSIDDIVDKII